MTANPHTENLRPWRWRRVANPHPAKWPGPWVAFRTHEHAGAGRACLAMLASYVGEERALHVARMLSQGRRAGRLSP